MNHASVSRSRKIRYATRSESAISHSSRSQQVGWVGWAWWGGWGEGTEFPSPVAATRPDLPDAPDAPDPPGPPDLPDSTVHHSPELRHGPTQCTTDPPAKPRRSVVTRTGRPFSTVTRAGTGWRQRRTADVIGRGW